MASTSTSSETIRRAPYGRRPKPVHHSAMDVLREIDRLERRAPVVEAQIAALQADAVAVAGEYGHELGEWYQSERLLTAARCTGCSATVALREDGYGSNAGALQYITAPCRPVHDRYVVVKSTVGPAVCFVRDSENPALGAVAMRRKAADAKRIAARLNALAAGDMPVDELAIARKKVERARAALAKAEAALAAVAA